MNEENNQNQIKRFNKCKDGLFAIGFHKGCFVNISPSFQSYKSVNELFALKTVEAIRRLEEERLAKGEDVVGNPPIVWVHDYHLMLAANTIRYYPLGNTSG